MILIEFFNDNLFDPSELIPEQTLAVAIIGQAWKDLKSAKATHRNDAADWFLNSGDFRFYAESIGADPDVLVERLKSAGMLTDTGSGDRAAVNLSAITEIHEKWDRNDYEI